ncbi:MAG: helical backbone metal receptor [Myxococcota bacterium]
MTPCAFFLLLLTNPTWYGSAPPTPSRVVSLAPSVTATIVALGATSRLVGVSRFDDPHPELDKLPRFGGTKDLSVEAVLAAQPDLVVSVHSQRLTTTHSRLSRLGVAVVTFDGETIDGFLDSVSTLGNLLDRREEASRLGDELQHALRDGSQRKPLQGETVLIVVSRKPLYAAGPSTYLGEIVRRLGAKNVVADQARAFVAIGRESVLALGPSVVIDLSGEPDTPIALARGRRWLISHAHGLRRVGPGLADGLSALVDEIESGVQAR